MGLEPRCNVDEAQTAFASIVVAGSNASGILHLVEAPHAKATPYAFGMASSRQRLIL